MSHASPTHAQLLRGSTVAAALCRGREVPVALYAAGARAPSGWNLPLGWASTSLPGVCSATLRRPCQLRCPWSAFSCSLERHELQAGLPRLRQEGGPVPPGAATAEPIGDVLNGVGHEALDLRGEHLEAGAAGVVPAQRPAALESFVEVTGHLRRQEIDERHAAASSVAAPQVCAHMEEIVEAFEARLVHLRHEAVLGDSVGDVPDHRGRHVAVEGAGGLEGANAEALLCHRARQRGQPWRHGPLRDSPDWAEALPARRWRRRARRTERRVAVRIGGPVAELARAAGHGGGRLPWEACLGWQRGAQHGMQRGAADRTGSLEPHQERRLPRRYRASLRRRQPREDSATERRLVLREPGGDADLGGLHLGASGCAPRAKLLCLAV